MTAFETACRLYDGAGHTAEDMIRDMTWHAMRGYVLSTPCEFALARPVALRWGEDKICDLSDNRLTDFELTLPLDCWHITVAVGDMRELMTYIPFPLPFISFERRECFRVYQMSKFL